MIIYRHYFWSFLNQLLNQKKKGDKLKKKLIGRMTLITRNKFGHELFHDNVDVIWRTDTNEILIDTIIIGHSKKITRATNKVLAWAVERRHFFTMTKKVKKIINGKKFRTYGSKKFNNQPRPCYN